MKITLFHEKLAQETLLFREGRNVLRFAPLQTNPGVNPVVRSVRNMLIFTFKYGKNLYIYCNETHAETQT